MKFFAQLDRNSQRVTCRSYVAACEVLDSRQPEFADRGFVQYPEFHDRRETRIVRHVTEYELHNKPATA